MFKKFSAFALVAALLCTLSGTPAFAQTKPLPDVQSNEVSGSTDSTLALKKEIQPGGSLKANIQKLVADARAGKAVNVTDPQNQPRQSNSLSKSVKIGIVVGIAVAVILIIVFVHGRNHLFDDFNLGN
jgi:predicted PurR-regulated permease PerM